MSLRSSSSPTVATIDRVFSPSIHHTSTSGALPKTGSEGMLRSRSPQRTSFAQTHPRTPSSCSSRKSSPDLTFPCSPISSSSTLSPRSEFTKVTSSYSSSSVFSSTTRWPLAHPSSPRPSSPALFTVQAKHRHSQSPSRNDHNRSRSHSPLPTQQYRHSAMSGPDQVQDAEANAGHEHKEQPQNQSRIRISNLLCSIEAAEPAKTALWESPRTEAVHLEGPPQARCSQSPPHSPPKSWQTHRDSRSEYEHSRQFEAQDRRYHVRPPPAGSPQANASQGPIGSSLHSSYDALHYPNSSSSSNTTQHQDGLVYMRSTSVHTHDSRRTMLPAERRDSGLGRRDIEGRDPAYSPHDRSYFSSGRDSLSRNTPGEHPSPFSTPPTTTSTGGHFAPRPVSSGQRSASLHAEYYQDNCHPYDVDQNRPRHDRSKSDFALHQQNYGPYLDASPPLAPAPLFQPRKASLPSPMHDNNQHPQHHGPSTPQSLPSQASASSYFHDHVSTPSDHGRSPYTPSHGPRRSIQGDSRRSSQGIILPPPESLYHTAESRKPARIYGLDAADVPARPPLAPSASYGSKPLQDIPDEPEIEYPRRPSMQHSADSGYRHSRVEHTQAPAPRYTQYPYEHRPSPSSPLAADADGVRPRCQDRPIERPQYDYGSREDSMRTSYSPQGRPEPRPYSPGNDIQPPSWYQQYAHAVPYKSQSQPLPRPSFSQADSHGYAPPSRRGSDYAAPRNMHNHQQQQQVRSPELWSSSRSSFSAGPPLATNGSDQNGIQGAPSRPLARPRMSSFSSSSTSGTAVGHSVHPFDIPAAGSPPTSPSSRSSNKRDRSQLQNDQEGTGNNSDPFVSEDGGVKAKRKRANAEQLSVLNAAFERSYFPSTEERLRLSKQTKMCPRTVQIWFQNKRQSVKARTEAMDAAVAAAVSSAASSTTIGPGRHRGSQAQGPSQSQSQDVHQRGGMDERHSRKRSHDEDNADVSPQHYSQYQHQHQYHQQNYQHQQYQQQQLPQRRSPLGQSVSPHAHRHGQSHAQTGEKRRNSGPLTPSDAVMSALQIQLDGRSVDYFSRKRRATIAQMEQSDR